MRKRLPEPKPKIETLSPVCPKARVGNFELEPSYEEARTLAVAPLTIVTATVSMNCLRFIGGTSATAIRKTRAKRRGGGIRFSNYQVFKRAEGAVEEDL